ncbi:MAG: ABC transporter permease [Planctomycetota bacterium]|nr:MAG: ABC transporter permease [Planctomycetota bacterium]REJ94863.1 MAG: ABC transporter permease [Planctomycetota bacterium]REK30735.1 MAG: ABC transporter permease [Planctomycetota bacterium]REK33110.1 MAG: ABC transporter permease [Planctomycetota bacterium]
MSASHLLTLAADGPAGLSSNSWLGIGTVSLFALLLLFDYLTRAGTIARATTKEAVRQPVFLLLSVLAILLIGANFYVPFFSLGEDTKMFIDCGLATILITALLLSVWTASMSVADEIEGKTAMTLLSKPITRRQFVFGKYVGIAQAALLLIIVAGAVFVVLTYFKFGYDRKESGQTPPDMYVTTELWGREVPMPEAERLSVASKILPALTLIFMEVAVMTAVSVAISTRLPMLVNIVVCFTIFVIAHLTPVLVESTFAGLPPVQLLAQLLATVLPNLESFNMSAAVATGVDIPLDYIGLSAAYSVVYIAAAVLLAFILFEDRDLA